MLPNLEVLVQRGHTSFVTSIYRKPTFTYINWDPFTLKSRKINLVKCLTNRALMICLDNRIEAELKEIT